MKRSISYLLLEIYFLKVLSPCNFDPEGFGLPCPNQKILVIGENQNVACILNMVNFTCRIGRDLLVKLTHYFSFCMVRRLQLISFNTKSIVVIKRVDMFCGEYEG